MPELVELWRAVDDAEHADLKKVSRFRLIVSKEVKYFALSEEGAVIEGNLVVAPHNGGRFWLAVAAAPATLLRSVALLTDATALGHVPMVALTGNQLRRLGAARIIGPQGQSP